MRPWLLLLLLLPLSDKHPNIVSQKRDGRGDKKRAWVDLAHSLLLSSFVYSKYKGEKAEENEGPRVFAALLKADLVIRTFTFCPSQDL